MAPRKRAHDATDATKSAAKKQKADVGDASAFSKVENPTTERTANLAIPVDEGCPLVGTHKVHTDKDGVIYDVSLNQSNAGNNNNKFYRIQLLEKLTGGEYHTWTRWGRVGERGMNATLGSGGFQEALAVFEKKFKDKTGHKWEKRLDPPKPNKYVFIERSYEPDTSEDDSKAKSDAGARRSSVQSIASDKSIGLPPSTLPLPVQNLMELIFNQQYMKDVLATLEYDVDKLPLGKLSKRTLEQGYQALKDLAALILNPESSNAMTRVENMMHFSNLFYSYIPHNFGRNRPPQITSESMLKREIELLESLSDMRLTEEIMKETTKSSNGNNVHPIDQQFTSLGMTEVAPLNPKSKEFKELANYLCKSKGDSHPVTYKVEDIFRIERDGECDRSNLSQFGNSKNSDRRLLWHGSRTTNFGGILSRGLRIAPPEAPASGYMFGKGIYLADMSSKSANYCFADYSGNTGLLLLCEAELGRPMLELTTGDYMAGERAREVGAMTTWAKGMMAPLAWKDAGCVHKSLKGVSMPDISVKPGDTSVENSDLIYNEYIAYSIHQVRLRYLFRVHMTGSGFY